MKRIACLAFCLATFAAAGSALAAEDPAGTWKWTRKFRDQSREMTLTLKLDGEKLTGSMPGRNNEERAIEDGSFKNDEVSFKVTRERNGVKRTSKYSGKVSGDTIKGQIEFERDGQTRSFPWEATRSK